MKSDPWRLIKVAALKIATHLAALSTTVLLAVITVSAQTAPWEGPAFAADPKTILVFGQQIKPDGYAKATVLLNEYHLTLDSGEPRKLVQHMLPRVETEDAIDGWSTIGAVWSP